MIHLYIPNWGKVVAEVVTAASFMHNFLPPYDWEPEFVSVGLADFPMAQKYVRGLFHNRWYKLLVYMTGYVALNARSTVWGKWISIKPQMDAAKATGVREGITAGVEVANFTNNLGAEPVVVIPTSPYPPSVAGEPEPGPKP